MKFYFFFKHKDKTMDTINMFSLTYTSISSFLGWYKKRSNSQVLDPLTCIVRLGTLSFEQVGTKISIHNNNMTLQTPTMLQGAIRWSLGDKSNDLHNLRNPIQQIISIYNSNSKKDLKFIFNFAIKGLQKLKKYYAENMSHSISHSLEHYISILENTVDGKKIDKTEKTDTADTLYSEFQKIWNDSEITVLCKLFEEAEKVDNSAETNPYIDSINTILENKDEQVKQIVEKTVSGN